MGDQCFPPGSLPVQSFELDGYLFTDVDGTQCYSEGDVIRDAATGRVADPDSLEIDQFKREWKIKDLTKINIGTANAVMRGYRLAEKYAAQGDIAKVNRYLHTVDAQTPYSGLVYDQDRVDGILKQAYAEKTKNENKTISWASKLLSMLPLSFPLGLMAGLGIYDSSDTDNSAT